MAVIDHVPMIALRVLWRQSGGYSPTTQQNSPGKTVHFGGFPFHPAIPVALNGANLVSRASIMRCSIVGLIITLVFIMSIVFSLFVYFGNTRAI
jgi:hypothetical protein